jgi:hypothetical protein
VRLEIFIRAMDKMHPPRLIILWGGDLLRAFPTA